MEIINLLLEKIKPDPNQPRQTFDEKRIKGMAQSFLTTGIINPIEIDKDLKIITGEQRWRAAKIAGLKEIPAKILDLNPKERFKRQVIENIHHQNMTDWDIAQAFLKLLNLPPSGRSSGKDIGLSRLSRELGVSDSYIQEKLNILDATKPLQKALREEKISFTHLRETMKTPPEFLEKVETKVLAGEFNRTNSVTEVVAALRRSPEQGQEILDIDYTPYKSTNEVIEVISKISPRVSDKIRESYNPVNDLSRIIDQLVNWLKINSPDKIGRIHAARIVFNLNGATNAINKWGKQVNQLKLKGNSDNEL